jgi:DNA-binding MarR family transcriptional regulator
MKRTPAGELLTVLILEIFRLNGRLLAAGDRLTRPAGQSSARWQVLGAVGEGPLPVAEVARRMGLTRQSVQRTADLLAAAGLVAYADNPSHRRAKLVTLTARGRSVLDRIDRAQVGWSNRLAGKLPTKDLATTLRVLSEVRRRLETTGNRETGR